MLLRPSLALAKFRRRKILRRRNFKKSIPSRAQISSWRTLLYDGREVRRKKNYFTTNATTVVKRSYLRRNPRPTARDNKNFPSSSQNNINGTFIPQVVLIAVIYNFSVMGNNISSHPLLPVTLADCYIDGSLNVYKYQIFLLLKRKRENDEFFQNFRNSSFASSDSPRCCP